VKTGDSIGLEIQHVTDSGDERGSSYPIFLNWFSEPFQLRDVHVTTLIPGHVRGNHYHVIRHEVLLVMHSDRWSLHWDTGEGTAVERRSFDGQGTTAICVAPYASHAIRNDGNAILHIVGLSDHQYSQEAPDTFSRSVTPL
jgi:dTDP-4-dehydrorhamnose 3,5-epimerase-like enzyme